MIKHSFYPKMCRKKKENQFTNKYLMPKNVFD